MKIIALDLGSNMGLAHNGMGVPIVEHHTFKGVRAHRLCDIDSWLRKRFSEIKHDCHIDLVVMERPFARGLDATRSLWGTAGIIEAQATLFGWPVTDAVPLTIKKWAAGSSKASKDDMITAAHILGYVGNNEHEADAFCLLKYAEANATILPKGYKNAQ